MAKSADNNINANINKSADSNINADLNKSADLIIKNAEIYSVNKENKLTISQAMAIKGEKIIFVGDEGDASSFEGSQTNFIDMEGKTVLPGLGDAHLHASMTAEQVYDFSMYGIRPDGDYDRKELIDKYRAVIKENVGKNPNIVRGVGWDPALFASDPAGPPTADELNGIADDMPIMLRSYDHHYIWVNNKALELSGIDKNTKTPRNGVITRDSDGNPTGVFQETTATDLLINNLPYADYTVEEYKEGIKAYQSRFANNYGTTLIFDAFNSANGMQAYYEMAKDDELTVRVNTCFYADPSLPPSQFDDMIAKKDQYHIGDMFNVNTVKFFMDGSGLSFYMNEPFDKDFLRKIGMPEDYLGYTQWDQAEINNAFLKLDSAGFQIHVHCMGDGATTSILNSFEYVSKRNDIKKNRHTITHLMQVKEDDMKRMADMGIIAAMQPMWPIYDRFAEVQAGEMFGAERVLEQYPIGSLRKAGVIVSAGTDFPITIPPNPYIGIQTALTRCVPKVHPDYEEYHTIQLGPTDNPRKNCVNLPEAVASYTIWDAYQCFLEDVTGSIEVGKSADFVLLDQKLTSVPSKEIEGIHAVKTYLKGKEVYSAE